MYMVNSFDLLSAMEGLGEDILLSWWNTKRIRGEEQGCWYNWCWEEEANFISW